MEIGDNKSLFWEDQRIVEKFILKHFFLIFLCTLSKLFVDFAKFFYSLSVHVTTRNKAWQTWNLTGVSKKAGHQRSTAAYNTSYCRLLSLRAGSRAWVSPYYPLSRDRCRLRHRQPLMEKVIETPVWAGSCVLWRLVTVTVDWALCVNNNNNNNNERS